MCEILLSINPEHVENIFNGTKGYEFRKVRCKKDVKKIVIYSTSPVMRVVGEAKVSEILEGEPEEVWKKTKSRAGIGSNFFKEYFRGRNKAFAFSLHDVIKYDCPKNLEDYGLAVAPQSFVYL